MELAVYENASLEGSGRVILTLGGEASLQAVPGDAVSLERDKRVCGAWVQAVERGPNRIEIDKFLRLHLQVRDGQMVSVRSLSPPDAQSVEVRVPPSWAQEEGLRLLGRFLTGRLASAGSKIPFFTLGGSTVLVEVVAVTPGPVARLASGTAFQLAKGAAEPEGQAAGVGYADIGGLGRELQRIRELV